MSERPAHGARDSGTRERRFKIQEQNKSGPGAADVGGTKRQSRNNRRAMAVPAMFGHGRDACGALHVGASSAGRMLFGPTTRPRPYALSGNSVAASLPRHTRRITAARPHTLGSGVCATRVLWFHCLMFMLHGCEFVNLSPGSPIFLTPFSNRKNQTGDGAVARIDNRTRRPLCRVNTEGSIRNP